MKTRYFKIAGLAIAAAMGFASCQDFLEQKQNFDNVSPELYNSWEGVQGRLSDVYSFCLPSGAGNGGTWQYPATGLRDMTGLSTEEYSGLSSSFVNPQVNFGVDESSTPDYFQGADRSNIQNNVWGLIRNINDAIAGISGGTLPQAQKDEALGQLYFLRAWRYFMLWKWYGGVPIITEAQPIAPESITPRSTSKEVKEFIISDLDAAAELLEPITGAGQWLSGSNYGRITTGTALAMKIRVLTWWCSPLFNRAGDQQRYIDAYDELKDALTAIDACGYGLEGIGTNADGWANMFSKIGGNREAVFFARHNSYMPDQNPDHSRNNGWEQAIRPSNALGGGGQNPSKMIIDLFPMSDGHAPAGQGSTKLTASSKSYNSQFPFLDRDPRFYRTFGFPGIKWFYNGTGTMSSDNRNPFEGNNYELWNYVWYEKPNLINESSPSYGADNLLANAKGMYVTKRSAADSKQGTYVYMGTTQTGAKGFQRSYASFIEMRYAEVLLNMAEIACGAGHADEAYEYLKLIRQRVGYEPGNEGLPSGNDAATCFAAILYERQIELAFEGKRFDDMRRWLLFDGGASFSQVNGAPSTWIPSGMWGSNTCTYLGVKELNGQRRDNMEYRVDIDGNGTGKIRWNKWENIPDPVANAVIADESNSATDWNSFRTWRTALAVDLSSADLQEKLGKLKADFYDKYLKYQTKRGDGYDSNQAPQYITYRPHYYFMGFTSGVQSANPTLNNTIGWGNGTFDPLAE